MEKSGDESYHDLDAHAHSGAAGPGQAGDEEVLLPGGIHPPQHGETHARAGAETGHEAREAECALDVELSHQDAGGTVGDKAHQCGHYRLEEAHPAQHRGEDILADALDDEAEHEAEHEDKDKDLEGVAERGLPDGLGMALFVAVLLVAVHLVGVAGVAAAQAAGQGLAEDEVQQKAHEDSVHDFDDHQQDQLIPVGGHGHQQGDSLVAGGEIDGHQRTQRDDAGGVEVGGDSREAALRHTAQHRARHRAPAAAARQQGLDALTVAGLDIFNKEIG